MQPHKALIALTLVILVGLAAVIWFYPPTGDFRVDNPFWNGLSTLKDRNQMTILTSLDNLPANGRGSVLLLVPYEEFTQNEISKLQDFVSSGGTLALLDDFGYGNQVLSGLGLELQFTGQPLLDPLFDYRNKWLPKITDFENTTISANVSSLVFNHATALNNTSGVTVAAYSSGFSYLDLNGNEAFDAEESYGPYPVVAYTKMGQGYVVAVSDPSLIINGMIELDDNGRFLANVLALEGANPQVYVDQSHLPKTPLDDSKAVLAVVYGYVASPLGTLTLIVVALALSLIPFWKRRGKP